MFVVALPSPAICHLSWSISLLAIGPGSAVLWRADCVACACLLVNAFVTCDLLGALHNAGPVAAPSPCRPVPRPAWQALACHSTALQRPFDPLSLFTFCSPLPCFALPYLL